MANLEQIYSAVTALKGEIQNLIVSAKLSPKQITIIDGLSDISKSLGTIYAGEFLALSSGEDPQDSNGTGTFMSALGRVFGSKTYHIGGVDDGDLKWGANSSTGELEAGDGTALLTEKGISIYDGTTEVARLGNLNGFLGYITDTYGIAIGTTNQYMTYDQTNGVQVVGAIINDRETFPSGTTPTYYVRTDGSDSNTGKANTAAGAFLTIQHAIDHISENIDPMGSDVYIYIGDGTYTENITCKPILGEGDVWIYGNATNLASVILTASIGFNIYSATPTPYYFVYLTIQKPAADPTNGYTGVFSDLNSVIYLGSIIFGNAGTSALSCHVRVVGGYLYMESIYISGEATNGYHIRVEKGGKATISYSDLDGALVSTDVDFGTFILVDSLSQVSVSVTAGFSWSTGTVTGRRYQVSHNSLIILDDASASFQFPGDAAGVADTGGLYY